MAPNFIGPYVLDFHYSSGGFSHILTLNMKDPVGIPDPGMAFADIDVVCHDDVTRDLATLVDAFVAQYKTLIGSNDGTIDYVDLSSVASMSSDRTFLSTYAIAVAGTHGSANASTGQTIMTWRSSQGGVFKLNWMSNGIAAGATVRPGSYVGVAAAINTYVISKAHPWIARDNGYPFAGLGYFPGANEAYFKKVFRP